MEKLKCPEIRFGGFGGDWDEGTFGSSLAFLQSGKSKERSDFGKFPFYGSTGTIGYSETFDYSGASILVARVGANAGTLYAVAGNYSVSDNTLIIKLKDGNEYVFFSNLLERFNLNKLVFGSGQPLITGGHLKAINVAIPPLQEQIQIGTFLQNFDQAIALRERKYTQTQNLKKAMLEKMFPKAGRKQPEIRLKGFGGDWEEFKLGQIYGFNYGEFNTNPSNGGQYQVYGANGIIGGYTSYNAESSAVIGHMGEYAGSVLWAEGKHFVTYNGTIAKPKKSDFNSLFGYFALVKMNLKKVCGGSGQPFLSYDALERLDVLFPTEKEQTAIGQFFKQLDDTLALQQQQLQTLKNLKHAFLAKMFV